VQVGTLDSLMQLSDDMVKMDAFGEGVVNKLASTLMVLFDRDEEKVKANLTANSGILWSVLLVFLNTVAFASPTRLVPAKLPMGHGQVCGEEQCARPRRHHCKELEPNRHRAQVQAL